MNSRSNFAVISLACLCLLNIWSSSESRSRRDTALGEKLSAFLAGLKGRQLTEEQKNDILIMKTALSSLNKTLAEKQEMKPTSQPNEPTTRQSSDEVWAFLDNLKGRQLTEEQKNKILIIKVALSSLNKTLAEKQKMKPTSQPNEPTTRQSSDEVSAFLDNYLKGRQLTEEQKNKILIIKAALSSLNKTLAENQEMQPTSQPNEPTTRQSSSTAGFSTKETSTTTEKTTHRSKTTTTKREIASTSSTMKVASTQKSSTLKVKTTSKSTEATSQTNEMTTTQSSTTAELSTGKTLAATPTSKPTSKITKTDTGTDVSKSSTMEAASTQKSSTSKVTTTSKSPKTTKVTEITTRKPSTTSVPHGKTSPTPERHTTPANTLPSTQSPTSELTPKTARESSIMKPSPQEQASTKKSIAPSNPSKTSKQPKKDGSTTTSYSNTSGSEGFTDRLFKHSSNFPAVFMVILVVIVAIYFGYHHRNKLHNFIKEGVSQPKHRGTGYLKVKVEDDTINLPREANREYIY